MPYPASETLFITLCNISIALHLIFADPVVFRV